jgi:acyl-CoA thioesterase FadM
MTSAILTRWPVVLEVAVLADDVGTDGRPRNDALVRWFALAWEEYLQRCPRLRDQLSRGGKRLSVGALRVSSVRAVQVAETLRIAIATTELWPTAFEIAYRVRVLSRDAGPVANGRCSVSFVSVADGSPAAVPDDVRSELIGLESTAFEYC